ncbi:MAG TPA: hypothetical protein VGI65_04970 [Steroidobacteraceae bacterium]
MKTLVRTLGVVSIAAVQALLLTARAEPAREPAQLNEARAFDFEFGDWKAHLSRRLKPLTGSTTWVEYDGTSIVRPIWKGAANLGELELDGPAGHIEGLSLRVYNPATHQWGISYANSAAGAVGLPMIGGFKDGRGEFYAQDTLNERSIFVRFIFSEITPRTFQLEQAFSDDGGKSWEPNWIAKFSR